MLEMLRKSYLQLDNRQRIGFLTTLIGLAGLLYCNRIEPKNFEIIFDVAKWIFGSMFFTILTLVGLVGMKRSKLSAFNLKIIDLIWILASAVAVALAAVQITQLSAESYRTIIKRNIEHSRSVAVSMTTIAYRDECLRTANLAPQQCDGLRRLNISLSVGGYLAPTLVGAICPRPIDWSAPPAHFESALIEGCINANYVAYAADDPVLRDVPNVDTWRLYTSLWPQLMILLVSLRVTKSVAEVFWNEK